MEKRELCYLEAELLWECLWESCNKAMGMGIPIGISRKSYGYGYGTGTENSVPRQPWCLPKS